MKEQSIKISKFNWLGKRLEEIFQAAGIKCRFYDVPPSLNLAIFSDLFYPSLWVNEEFWVHIKSFGPYVNFLGDKGIIISQVPLPDARRPKTLREAIWLRKIRSTIKNFILEKKLISD